MKIRKPVVCFIIIFCFIPLNCFCQNWSSVRLLQDPEKFLNKKEQLFVLFAEVPALNATDDLSTFRDFNCYTGIKDMGRVDPRGYIVVRVPKAQAADFCKHVGTVRQYSNARLIRGILKKDNDSFFFEFLN